MKKFVFVSLVSLAFVLPSSAYAQDALQNSALQQQTSGTQATGGLQNDTNGAIQQNANPNQTLQQPQPESLGVVAQPNQTQPSVEVGASATTTSVEAQSSSNNSWLLAGLFLLAIVGGLIAVLIFKRKPTPETQSVENLYETSELSEATISSSDENPTPTPSKSTKPKKRKKKKAHR